jgi:hypothetical protein
MINYDPNKGRRPLLGGISARYLGDGGGTDISQESTLTGGQRSLLDSLTSLLQGELGQGADTFGGQRVAGLSPLQQQAFGQAGGALPLAQQLFGMGNNLPQAFGQAQDQLTKTLQDFDPQSTISNFAPARDVAVRQFENVTIPNILERFAGAGGVRSSAAPQAIADAGSDLSQGLSAQLGQLLQQGEQSQLNRQQAGIGQALQVGQAPLNFTQQAGQAGLGLLGGVADFGAQQRSLEQQQLNALMAQFQEGQASNNPFLNLLPQALGTTAFENVAQQGGGGLGSILGGAFGSFAGSEAGAGALAGLFGGGAGAAGLAGGAGGAGTMVAALSDARMKENIKVIDSPLDKVAKLNGYSYNYKFNDPDNRNGGIMAQDLEKVLPDAVSTIDGVKMVRYDAVVGLLVEAVKELNSKIKDN